MSDFIKEANEIGKVKSLQEAFEKNPIEQIVNFMYYFQFICENDETYVFNEGYNIGDIVYATRYIYATGKEGYNHLFVIIDQEHDTKETSIQNFGMLISSQVQKIKYKSNLLLKKDGNNNLKTDSIVKTDEVYELNKRNILFKIGNIDKELVTKYKIMCLEQIIK